MASPKILDSFGHVVQTYYQVLGVAEDATTNDIRIAFQQMALVCHPDKGGSVEAFQKLRRAYEAVRTPDDRALYDRDRVEESRSIFEENRSERSESSDCFFEDDDGDRPKTRNGAASSSSRAAPQKAKEKDEDCYFEVSFDDAPIAKIVTEQMSKTKHKTVGKKDKAACEAAGTANKKKELRRRSAAEKKGDRTKTDPAVRTAAAGTKGVKKKEPAVRTAGVPNDVEKNSVADTSEAKKKKNTAQKKAEPAAGPVQKQAKKSSDASAAAHDATSAPPKGIRVDPVVTRSRHQLRVDPVAWRSRHQQLLDDVLPHQAHPFNIPHGESHYTVALEMAGNPVRVQVRVSHKDFRLRHPKSPPGYSSYFSWKDDAAAAWLKVEQQAAKLLGLTAKGAESADRIRQSG